MPSKFTSELAAIQSIIEGINETPFCNGTVPWDTDKLGLFYLSEGSNANYIKFPSATDAELENLAKACEPATFGRNDQDILDPSYRKAGKMDTGRFATHFTPANLGIMNIIREALFRGQSKDSIDLELYKLNVYGPGGFFKAHVDTPRGETMFGSLVVVLPTVHEGGSLVLRHHGTECTFDTAADVKADLTAPHATFIAFFSDVEHEVKPVSSGYRVTLTYNLYRGEKKSIAESDRSGIDMDVKAIEEPLAALLGKPDFLPNGGALGFGLSYKYPIAPGLTSLSAILRNLKGSDVSIKRACESLALVVEVKVVYRSAWGHEMTLVDKFADLSGEIEGLSHHLRRFEGGKRISESDRMDTSSDDESDSESDDYYERQCEPDKTIHLVWVKPLASTNNFTSAFISYGNEASLSHAYGEVCLVAVVPPRGGVGSK